MYSPREFFANQNVATVGERYDEDHTVPTVMKLIEKLTDEEVDDRRNTLSSAARGHTSSSDRRKNRGIPRERIPERVTAQIVNMALTTHTHKVVEKIIKDSQSHAASCERTGCKDCLKTGSSGELVNKL